MRRAIVVLAKPWRRSSRTTSTKTRTPIWSCRRNCPSSTTNSTRPARTGSKRTNANRRTTSRRDIAKRSFSSWRRTGNKEPMRRVTMDRWPRTLRPRCHRLRCPIGTFVRFVDFYRATLVLRVAPDIAVFGAWALIGTRDA